MHTSRHTVVSVSVGVPHLSTKMLTSNVFFFSGFDNDGADIVFKRGVVQDQAVRRSGSDTSRVARHEKLTAVVAKLCDEGVWRVLSSSSPVARAVLVRHCFTISLLGTVLTHHARSMSMTTVPNKR